MLAAKYDTLGFATDLDGLDLGEFTSILVVPEANADVFTAAQRGRFTLFLPVPSTVDASDPEILGHLAAVRLPELEAVITEALGHRDADDVHLVSLEEELLRPLARLRERFDLPGERPDDLARFVDKRVMKERFRWSGITTPSGVVLQGIPDEGLAAVQASIEAELSYPLFAKPCDGVASAATARLAEPDDLRAWLEERRGTAVAFLIEDFVVGVELFAYGLVQRGQLSLLSVDRMHLPMFEAIEAGAPVAEISLPRGSAEHLEVESFVRRVFESVAPVPDGCFVAQLMRSRQTGRLHAMEISARLPGDIAPRTLLWATGLNVEVHHLRLRLPHAPWVPIPTAQRAIATMLFPRRAGVVEALREVPALSSGTASSVVWHVAPGEVLPPPPTYDAIACAIQLTSEDEAALAEDFRRLVSFDPLILRGEPGGDPAKGEVSPRIAESVVVDGALTLRWRDEEGPLELPLLWLRDHCPCPSCTNPETLQRELSTHELADDLAAELHVDEDAITLTWAQDGHQSRYEAHWLATVARGPAAPERELWDRRLGEAPPRVPYDAVMDGDAGLKEWLLHLERYGIAFVTDTPATPEATQLLAERITYIRHTIFGGFWDFTAGLAHLDTAYTDLSIGPHTDGTYSYDAPGAQMFHCLRAAIEGGENTFVDGFHLAEILRRDHPEDFAVLSRTPVTAQYVDPGRGIHLLATRPILRVDERDAVVQVSFNNADRAPMIRSLADTRAFYRALRNFTRLAIDPTLEVRRRLVPGEVVLVDNWRILHGRTAFRGDRRICGVYLNQEDVQSRLRTLRARAP